MVKAKDKGGLTHHFQSRAKDRLGLGIQNQFKSNTKIATKSPIREDQRYFKHIFHPIPPFFSDLALLPPSPYTAPPCHPSSEQKGTQDGVCSQTHLSPGCFCHLLFFTGNTPLSSLCPCGAPPPGGSCPWTSAAHVGVCCWDWFSQCRTDPVPVFPKVTLLSGSLALCNTALFPAFCIVGLSPPPQCRSLSLAL